MFIRMWIGVFQHPETAEKCTRILTHISREAETDWVAGSSV